MSLLSLVQCSVDCGVGRRLRSVRCVSDHGNEVHEKECHSRLRPEGSEDCNMGPCVTNWYFTGWANTVSYKEYKPYTHANRPIATKPASMRFIFSWTDQLYTFYYLWVVTVKHLTTAKIMIK